MDKSDARKGLLNSLFTYDDTLPSGLRGKPSTRHKNGLARGFVSETCKYYRVKIKGKQECAHRVIWEMHNGAVEGDNDIDHIDGDILNNKLENLRSVSRSVNCRNKSLRSDNSTGFQGISKSTNACGNVYYVFQWETEFGEIKRESFSGTKLGLDEALAAAVEYKATIVSRLVGAGYSLRHLNAQ